MKSKNKLYTLSYFRKRLKGAGFSSKILINNYDEDDKRYWTISIHKEYSIICTCLKYETDGILEVSFHFTDCGQKIIRDKTVQTESMNIITEMLEKLINT